MAKTAAIILTALAISAAGCGSNGLTASEARCLHEKQEAREYAREAREGVNEARETGSMAATEAAAERGLRVIGEESKDCKH